MIRNMHRIGHDTEDGGLIIGRDPRQMFVD